MPACFRSGLRHYKWNIGHKFLHLPRESWQKWRLLSAGQCPDAPSWVELRAGGSATGEYAAGSGADDDSGASTGAAGCAAGAAALARAAASIAAECCGGWFAVAAPPLGTRSPLEDLHAADTCALPDRICRCGLEDFHSGYWMRYLRALFRMAVR